MKPLEWFRGKRAAWIERGLLDREKRKGLLINWHSRLDVWGSTCCWCDQASSPRATWSFFGKTCQESAMRNFKSLTIQQGLMLYRADWNLQGVVWLRIGLDLKRSEEEHRRFAWPYWLPTAIRTLLETCQPAVYLPKQGAGWMWGDSSSILIKKIFDALALLLPSRRPDA